MRIKHGLMLSSVALITMMLFPSLVEGASGSVTRYPPYAYGEMTTHTGGYLASGYAKIYRAEIDRFAGKMYAHHSAQSVVWIAHDTAVDFYMGNTYPTQSVYVERDYNLRTTVRIWFKGSFRGYGNTGYSRVTVKVRILNYQGYGSVYTVADYIAEKGVTIYLGTQNYVVDYAVPKTGYYASQVEIYTECCSGNSGGAWVDFGSGENFIELSWIQYSWWLAGLGCPILSVYNGEEYVEEGLLDIHATEDVVRNYTLTTTPQPVNHAYLLRLTEHPLTHSYIDQVRLFATLEDGTTTQLPLISAEHSEDGNVLPKLLFSDDVKADTLGAKFNNGTSQSIDLKFSALPPSVEVQNFVFIIEGVNIEPK